MDKNTNMPTVFKIKKRYVVKNFLVLFLNEIKEKKKKTLVKIQFMAYERP